MADKTKKEQASEIAKDFAGLDEEHKIYITGYMNGIQEERQKWKRKKKPARGA